VSGAITDAPFRLPAAPEQAAAPGPQGVDLGQAMSGALAAGPAQAPASNPLAVKMKEDSQVEQTGCATC